jgi:hypothetical protein
MEQWGWYGGGHAAEEDVGGHGSMVGWRCRPATPKAGGRGQAALRHARSAPETGDAGSLTSGLGATVTGGGSLNWG